MATLLKATSARSYWLEYPLPHFDRCDASQNFDTVIVGGGITGLTIAYFLKLTGRKVAVVERDRIGVGDTCNTTAHVTMVTDHRFRELSKTLGNEYAVLAWRGGEAALELIEAIAESCGRACDLKRVPAYLSASWEAESDEQDELAQEAQLIREAGFDAAFVENVPIFHRPGIRFENQLQLHPLKYLHGLAELVNRDGSKIFENSEAVEFQADPLRIRVGDHWLSCQQLVVATHVPMMGKAGLLRATLFQTKIAPYSSYVIGARINRLEIPEALYWDTAEPYYYLRTCDQGDHAYLIFGGCDHKTGQGSDTEANYQKLESILRRYFPDAQVDHRWSGQVIETHDGLPYVGEIAENQYIATGYCGNGITFGTLGAMIISDSICQRENPWKEAFAPARKKLVAATWNYLKENLDYPYFLIKDWLTGGSEKSINELAPGEGQILSVQGKRAACYRDPNGNVSMVSAICTHLGCIVHWNSAARTWDCPCHGSRFETDGKVIAGPAETPLKPMDDQQRAD